MSNTRPPEQVLTKPVACWLTQRDYNRIMAISDKYKIRVAVFIRSIIIDALADEDDIAERSKNKILGGQDVLKNHIGNCIQRGC